MRALILAYKTKKHGKTGNCQGVTLQRPNKERLSWLRGTIFVTTRNIKDFLSLDWRIMYTL